jgi:DNA invertase Pin-like site-specific DNA recombinase
LKGSEKAFTSGADNKEMQLKGFAGMYRENFFAGFERVTARGQHMGRPPALTPQQQAEARQRRTEGATLKELARSYDVSAATISRLRI